MSFKGILDHTAPLFARFNVLTVGQINCYMAGIYTFKSLKDNINNVFTPYVQLNYNTRLSVANTLALPDTLECATSVT